MDIPLLFGPYSSAALAHSDQLAPYDANAIGFICLTSAFEAQLAPAIDVFATAVAHIRGNAAGAMPGEEAST